jgi:hypothetical protein
MDATASRLRRKDGFGGVSDAGGVLLNTADSGIWKE